jgi:transcriptional regulator with XRE-family HTH domain
MDELRRIRKERGLSQQRLADLANVDKVTIVHIEGGKVSPKVETLAKLAAALGVELGDLFPKAQPPLLEDLAEQRRPPIVQGEAHLRGTGKLRATWEIMDAVDEYTRGEISREELEERVGETLTELVA